LIKPPSLLLNGSIVGYEQQYANNWKPSSWLMLSYRAQTVFVKVELLGNYTLCIDDLELSTYDIYTAGYRRYDYYTFP